MSDMRENFETVDDSGTGAAEVSGAISGEDPAKFGRWQATNTFVSGKNASFCRAAGEVESAAGENYDIR